MAPRHCRSLRVVKENVLLAYTHYDKGALVAPLPESERPVTIAGGGIAFPWLCGERLRRRVQAQAPPDRRPRARRTSAHHARVHGGRESAGRFAQVPQESSSLRGECRR